MSLNIKQCQRASSGLHRLIRVGVTVGAACILILSNSATVTLNADPTPIWPESWTVIDEDTADSGPAHRDVLTAGCSVDDSYIYLRLTLVEPPDFSTTTRYKWFFGVGEDADIGVSGNIVSGATHLLLIEDTGHNSATEVYLLDSHGDDTFDGYEPWAYLTDPGPTTSDVAGWRITGNSIDLYVSRTALDLEGAMSGLQLLWATDTTNGNLVQAESDRPDNDDIPLVFDPPPRAMLTAQPEPVDAGGILTYKATITNDGLAPLPDATGNEFEVAVPSNTAYVPGSVLVNGVPDDSAAHYDGTSGLLTWNGVVPAGSMVELQYQVTVVSPLPNRTIVSSQATVWYDSDDDGIHDSSVVSDDPRTPIANDPCLSTVTSSPRLVLTAPSSLWPVRAGRTTSYEISLANQGNEVATDVVLELGLPPELSVVAVEPPPTHAGNTVWTSPSLSPADGPQTVRVTLEVDRRLDNDSALVSLATVTAAEGLSSSASTTVPSRAARDADDNDDDDDDDDTEWHRVPRPQDEEEVEAPPDTTPPLPPTPLLYLSASGSVPGGTAFDVNLSGIPTDCLSGCLYFQVPDDYVVSDVVLHQRNTFVAVDGNHVSLHVSGPLQDSKPATIVLAPLASAAPTPRDFVPCPALFACLQMTGESFDSADAASLVLSILNVGDCPTHNAIARWEIPPSLSVVQASANDIGIISVSGTDLTPLFGTIEAEDRVSILVDVVGRATDDSSAPSIEDLRDSTVEVSVPAG